MAWRLASYSWQCNSSNRFAIVYHKMTVVTWFLSASNLPNRAQFCMHVDGVATYMIPPAMIFAGPFDHNLQQKVDVCLRFCSSYVVVPFPTLSTGGGGGGVLLHTHIPLPGRAVRRRHRWMRLSLIALSSSGPFPTVFCMAFLSALAR